MNSNTIKTRLLRLAFVLVCFGVSITFALWYATPNLARNGFIHFLECADWKKQFIYPQSVRYGFFLLDNDNIPEMVLIEGNGHADKVYIYRFNVFTQDVEPLGAVSIFGGIQYVPRGNTIVSQYGGMGFYYHVCSSIENDRLINFGTFLSDAAEEQIAYYVGFPISSADQVTSSLEKYRVTKKEYDEAFCIAIDGRELQAIEYSDLNGCLINKCISE